MRRLSAGTWLALVFALIAVGLLAWLGMDLLGGPARVSYLVTVATPPEQMVTVEARLEHLPRRITTLRLGMNTRYAFVMPDSALLAGPPELTAADGRQLTLRQVGPFEWLAALGSTRDLALRYRVPLTQRALPGVAGRDEYEQPFMLAGTDGQPGYGMLSTGAVFIAPLNAGEPELRVSFAPPAGWALHVPWPEAEPGVYAPAGVADLREDLVALGAWSVREVERGGCRVEIAVAPGQERLERLVTPFVARIVEAELGLFGMTPQPRYLFLFHPGRADFFAGSPKSNSMTLQLSADPERPFKLADLSRLVAHEFHHTWVHARYAPPDVLRFFNEGFTDYYAFLVSARLGLIDWERFGEELAERMDRLAANPLVGQMSLAEAGGPIFFESELAGDLVYHGGTLLAALLDRHLRAAGDSLGLDGFMRGFNNDPRWGWEHAPGLSDFVAAVASAAGEDYAAALRARVTEPWSLDPVTAFAEEGVTVTRQPAPGGERYWLDPAPWQMDAAEVEHGDAVADSL